MRALAPILALAAGCNAYDDFVLAGYVQDSFTNKADLLFVIDNSASMADEADALAVNFGSFIEGFADAQPPTEIPTLSEEIERYLESLGNRGASVNYHIATTTTEAWLDQGALLGQDPVLTKTEANVPRKFVETLLCEAACITPEIDVSVDVDCPGGGTPGTQNCANNEFGSAEEGIEPVYAAMCRGVDVPPEECFKEWWWDDATGAGRWRDDPPPESPDDDPVPYLTRDAIGSNSEWLREGSVVIPVVVTDEGDQSRRIPGRDVLPDPYPELFRAFGHRMSWAVIGSTDDCPGLSVDWGRRRYEALVDLTSGVYIPIAEKNAAGECEPADFGEALGRVGDLLRGLSDTFPLRTPPVNGTIVVTVNGQRIDEAEATYNPELERDVYGDGWYYDAVDNSVRLTGDAVPDFDADVSVWYLPTAPPRDLPF